MTQEQFCYWLQGKMEGRDVTTVTASELMEIQNHLALVFQKMSGRIGIMPGITNVPNYPTTIC